MDWEDYDPIMQQERADEREVEDSRGGSRSRRDRSRSKERCDAVVLSSGPTATVFSPTTAGRNSL